MFSNPGIISRTSAFILACGNGRRLDPLTRNRAKPLVPFGGIFRIIDFTLSNCVNSGLKNLFLLAQHKQSSLCEYVEKVPNSLVECLLPGQGRNFRGTADAVFQNIHRLEGEGRDFVLLLPADQVSKLDYTKLLRWHAESGADITVAATPHPLTAAPLGMLEVDGENGVTAAGDRNELRRRAGKGKRTLLVSTGIYVFNIRALLKLVIEDAFRTRSSHDFTRDVIPASIASHRVSAYNLASADGLPRYWRDVGTIDAYHRSHMELLLVDSAFDPYNDALWPVYAFGNPHAGISCLRPWSGSWSRDSVVSCGSAISGARLVQSVIGPAARVHESAEVQNSVLLPGVHVGRGARICRAVIEEGTRIPEGMEIGYDRELDSRRFRVTEGGVVMVTAEAASSSQPDWSKVLEA